MQTYKKLNIDMIIISIIRCSPLLFQAKDKSNGSPLDKSVGMLLYSFATGNVKTPERLSMMVDYICSGKITSQAQLTGKLILKRNY